MKKLTFPVDVKGEKKFNKYQDSLCLTVTAKETRPAQVVDVGFTATEWTCSCKYERNWNMQENWAHQVVYNSTGRARESLQREGNTTEILLSRAVVTSKQFNRAPSLNLASRSGLLSLPTGFVCTVGTCGDASCPSFKGNRRIKRSL